MSSEDCFTRGQIKQTRRGSSQEARHGSTDGVLFRNPSVPQGALGAVSRTPDNDPRPQTICDIVRPQNARIVFFRGDKGPYCRRSSSGAHDGGPPLID